MVKRKKSLSTEQNIFETARRIFLTRGMTGARMQDIADAAGINKAMLHYYFRDKDKLFETVFFDEAQKFFPKIKMIFESEQPLLEKIEKFVEEYINEMLENPYLPWFVMNEINRDPERFLHRIWGKANAPDPSNFLAQMEKEVKKGTIRKISPMQLLINILSLTIFPFVARPMIQRNLHVDDMQFRAVMEQRKKEIPAFIMAAIKK